MEDKEVSMITMAKDSEPYKTTEPLKVYKWLAETMLERYRGGKDVYHMRYHEKYDGYRRMTFYISNGTRIEIKIPRS